MSLARQIIAGMLPTLVSVVLAWQAHAAAAYPSVSLVDPVSERGVAGLFNKIVTARGAEIDSAQAGYHARTVVQVIITLRRSAVSEIYVVIELSNPRSTCPAAHRGIHLDVPRSQPSGGFGMTVIDNAASSLASNGKARPAPASSAAAP